MRQPRSKVRIASNAVSKIACVRSAWRRVTSISRRASPLWYWRRQNQIAATASTSMARSNASKPVTVPRNPLRATERSICATMPQPRSGSARVTAHSRRPWESGSSTFDSTPSTAMAAARITGRSSGTRSPAETPTPAGGEVRHSTSAPSRLTR
jgi:hypothetical protein